MRVNSVSSSYYKPCKIKHCKNKSTCAADGYSSKHNVQFNAKFGRIVGGAVGASAVLITSFVAAPVLVCLTGAGLFAGMLGGDVAEDAINKKDD